MKKVITLLAIAGVIAACNTKQDCPESLGSKNTEIVKTLFVHFNNHAWEKMAALYADPALFLDPSLGQEEVTQTKRQTIVKYQELAKYVPDVHDSISQIYPVGEKHVVVEFIASGTGSDGKKWTLPMCDIFEIKNGRIVSDHTYYDQQQ